MRSGGGLAQKLGTTMNIWRFATIVAGSCVTVVLVAIFALAAYMGRLASLTTSNVFELLLGMLVLITLIFSIITFPYYWFRIMRV
jgi:tetrahydromethanopterin S-methyltransferase subunit E